jgi:hypothetical protein
MEESERTGLVRVCRRPEQAESRLHVSVLGTPSWQRAEQLALGGEIAVPAVAE